MKSGVVRQLDSRVRTVRWHAVLLTRSFLYNYWSTFSSFCKLFN